MTVERQADQPATSAVELPGTKQAVRVTRHPAVIALSGYVCSGKDSVARILVEQHGYTRLAFADALKEMALAIDPYVELGNQQYNRLTWIVGEYGWEAAKQHADVRRFLQRLGTEGVRKTFGADAWLNVWWRRAPLTRSRIVVPDCRFPNEGALVQRLRGEVWRILRPGIEATNQHASETSMDAHEFDATIVNSGTLGDLAERVRDALARLPVSMDTVGHDR